jgi:serine/threonine-protein kinase
VCERDGSPLEQVEQVLAGRYVLKSVIGSGNMGTVYRATQLPMGRDVAVKLMHSDLVRNPDLVERFEREAQAAATVDHPNAITVFDSGRTSDGQVYISMELLEGESLSAMIDREVQISPERALELWIPVVKAMVVAHRKGVIHRDLKPDLIWAVGAGGAFSLGCRGFLGNAVVSVAGRAQAVARIAR